MALSNAGRMGDLCSAHPIDHPAAPTITGSTNVSHNGSPALREGDHVQDHPCVCGEHAPHVGSTISGASDTVRINKRRAARLADAVSCGARIATGSDTVWIGSDGRSCAAPPPREELSVLPDPREYEPAPLMSYLPGAIGPGRIEPLVRTKDPDGSIVPLRSLWDPDRDGAGTYADPGTETSIWRETRRW